MKLRSALWEGILLQDVYPGTGGNIYVRFFRGLFASLQVIAMGLLAAFFWLPWNVYSYLLGVCVGISVAYWLCLPKGKVFGRREWGAFLPWILLYLLFLVSISYSADVGAGWRACGRSLSMILYPVLFLGMKRDFFTPGRLRLLAVCFVAGCLLECLVKWGIMVDVFLSNPDLEPYRQRGWKVALNQFLSYQGPYMAGKELMHTTYEALLLNFAFALTGMAWIREDAFFKSPGRRWAAWLAMAVLAFVLLTSNSKIGQVLFFCTVLILWVQTLIHKKYRKTLGLSGVLVLLGGLAMLTIGKGVTNRVKKTWESVQTLQIGSKEAVFDDLSALPRLYCWKTAATLIQEHPWLGIGIGSRQVFSERFQQLYPDYRVVYWHPHNQFLAILMTHGVVGLLLFLWFLFKAFVYLCRARNVLWWIWGLGLLMVCMTDVFIYGVYGYMYMWGLYGLAAMEASPRHKFVHSQAECDRPVQRGRA